MDESNHNVHEGESYIHVTLEWYFAEVTESITFREYVAAVLYPKKICNRFEGCTLSLTLNMNYLLEPRSFDG